MNTPQLTIALFLAFLSHSLFGQWSPVLVDINPHIITTTGEAGNDIPTIRHHDIPFLRFELNQVEASLSDGAGINFRQKRQLGPDGNYTSDAMLFYRYATKKLFFAKSFGSPESSTVYSFDTDLQNITESTKGFANFGRLNYDHLSFDECSVQARVGTYAESTLRINPYGGGVVINGGSLKTAADDEVKLFGDLCLTGMIKNPSDSRFKKNITKIDNALEKIEALSPVTYQYDTEKFPSMHLPSETRRGFIAQEVEELFPEMVFEDGSENEYKSMNYQEIIPIAVKAIQEQQGLISDQAIELKALKSLVSELIDAAKK